MTERNIGRPSHVPKKGVARRVRSMLAKGSALSDVAVSLGVTRYILLRHYETAVMDGRDALVKRGKAGR